MSPADGILFLRRAGIEVFHELIDAVATIALREDTDEALALFRQLKSMPVAVQAGQKDDAALIVEKVPPGAGNAGRTHTLFAVEPAIPGAMPTTRSGKCAVKAAWQIEQETTSVATVDEVMNRLMQWAAQGSEPDLKEVGEDRRSVVWITDKFERRTYNKEALGKTLKKWNEGRRSKTGRI